MIDSSLVIAGVRAVVNKYRKANRLSPNWDSSDVEARAVGFIIWMQTAQIQRVEPKVVSQSVPFKDDHREYEGPLPVDATGLRISLGIRLVSAVNSIFPLSGEGEFTLVGQVPFLFSHLMGKSAKYFARQWDEIQMMIGPNWDVILSEYEKAVREALSDPRLPKAIEQKRTELAKALEKRMSPEGQAKRAARGKKEAANRLVSLFHATQDFQSVDPADVHRFITLVGKLGRNGSESLLRWTDKNRHVAPFLDEESVRQAHDVAATMKVLES